MLFFLQTLSSDESDYFFLEWYNECMVENNTVKNPDWIANRCDPNKVEILINQYLQGDTELKTRYCYFILMNMILYRNTGF